MSADPTSMEPQRTMNLNNHQRSGSWSGHRPRPPTDLQQQLQQPQQETKALKSSFLTKFMQKRTASFNEDSSMDTLAPPQPLLSPAPQQPMLSTPLLKKQGQAINKKKGNSLGRFLKKLGKNSTSVDKAADVGTTIFDKPPPPLQGNDQLQIDDDNSPTRPILHDLEPQAMEQLPHRKPIFPTPADKTTIMEAPRGPRRSAKDDIQLQYYRVSDISTANHTASFPRSSSFDDYRTHHHHQGPTLVRHPVPGSFYSGKSKPLSPPQSSMNDSDSPNDIIEPTITVSGKDTEVYHGNDDEEDDDDGNISTIDSIQSDSEEEEGQGTLDGDHLSKRLSGGHFGSAGGLIINTLSLSELSTINSHASSLHQTHQDTNNNDQHPTFEPTPTPTPSIIQQQQQGGDKHDTEWTGSTGLATPPRGNSNDVYPDDTQDTDHLSHSSSMVNDTSTAEDYARRIWEQDHTVYSNLDHVAEWIGNGSTSSQHILKCYMSYFDFSHQRLENAFRQLCGKLSMKAESQQIDRILEEFSKRYWECNPHAVFGNTDVIHAIVYSLVLLNTDLHIAQGERKKMSRPAFIRNTMDAIRSQLDCPRANGTTGNLERHSDIGSLSLADIKHASSISLQSQQYKDLKRTPSGRSNYSQNSGYKGKGSSSFDLPLDSTVGSYMWQAEMEMTLKQLYTSIRHKQIMQPGSEGAGDAFELTKKTTGFKRNMGTRMWKAARDSLFISDNTNGADIDFSQPLTPRSTVSSMSGKHSRRRSISSMRSGTSQHSQYTRTSSNNNHHYSGGTGSVNYQAVASLLHHSNLPTSFTSAAPYYKEGMLVRKHLMEQAHQKARQRDWKECFMVVDRGEIRMYRLEAHGHRRKSMAVSSRHPLHGMISRGASLATVSESITSCDQSSITSDIALGGGDWLAHAQIIGRIDLKHTLSNALPSGYSQQRQHAFALQQTNGGVYLFQVGSTEQVLEWVTTCNYWAARESKEPLMGGVGNLEYGWGACLDGIEDDGHDDDSTHLAAPLYQWQPPTPPMMASTLGEVAQLDTLQQHIRTLNDELDRHRDLKWKIERRFPRKTPNHVCAMSNFENKTQYLLHEIIKYQNYCDSIENSLALQDKALQETGKQEQAEIVVGP